MQNCKGERKGVCRNKEYENVTSTLIVEEQTNQEEAIGIYSQKLSLQKVMGN